MSLKWRRVQRWDAENLTGPLRPVRWVLHTLSSIWFAVVLLTLVACYGALASVPIGLIALIPTWIVVSLTAMACVAVGGGIGAAIAQVSVPPSRRGLRFTVNFLLVLAGAFLSFWAWRAFLWPVMKFDPGTGEGFRLFAEFAAQYESTTLRRLPGVEMSELEFYSWWPLRLILLLFVLNLTVATIRRIEFTFKNIGVLTVHTGIIVIALGSVYYQALKKEGDTLLLAGQPDATGDPAIGPPRHGFYDNTHVALWVAQRSGHTGAPAWESRPLRGVPRYNDYGLDAAPPLADGATIIGPAEHFFHSEQRDLDVAVPSNKAIDPAIGRPRVDADIDMRVVGYAEYASPAQSLIVVEGENLQRIPPGDRRPVRVVELLSRVPDESGQVSNPDDAAFSFTLRPDEPAARISRAEAIAVEYTIGMDPDRVEDLLVKMPGGAERALVVEIPDGGGEPARVVMPAREGESREVGGWNVRVRRVMPDPPFSIITPGYEGAMSSMAVVEVVSPGGETFDRWVYHRFPGIAQDMLAPGPDGGRPKRRGADPSIEIGLVDASRLQLYFNEDESGEIDLIIREPRGPARLVEDIKVGEKVSDVVDLIDFRVAEAHDHAMVYEHPVPVPESERDKQLVGTHNQAMIAVEVAADDPTSPGERWETVVWVPFAQYMDIDSTRSRTVELPGGRSLMLQFGRIWHPFPNFAVQLVDFEMIAYDHRGAPRDYQSIVRVSPTTSNADFEAFEHVVKLNAPLRAPYMWSEDRSLAANIATRLTGGLNPNQFKLSQSGWDRDGWNQTQQMADAGQIEEPYARYTILQVGNNPGIHVIALGGILMGLGIPWAFYVKPWLVRRERRRLTEQARQSEATKEETSADAPAARPDEEGAVQPAHQA